jgi:hypothetical protein
MWVGMRLLTIGWRTILGCTSSAIAAYTRQDVKSHVRILQPIHFGLDSEDSLARCSV